MISLLAELVMAPLLVGGCTLAHRRWGAGAGGLVSAFPAVVGPVLLITAQEQGAAFAARAANGTLLGLVTLSGFVATYARTAGRGRWSTSLAAGWACATILALLVGWIGHGFGLPASLGAGTLSLVLAHRLLPRLHPSVMAAAYPGPLGDNVPLRMAITALLVGALGAAAGLVGPLVGGLLAALPVLASVLAVFTHRRHGAATLVALLRGMLVGMAGFVGFCAMVSLLIGSVGTAPAFAVAGATAVGLQMLVLDRDVRGAESASSGDQRARECH